ncbi:MAG TPA: DUF3108 domain-containing protein [Longimicrobiales bacterium]|jgi:hypothetical protein|nr:DUF3108 domain-containing protein [Longimicrobiales bacterium]
MATTRQRLLLFAPMLLLGTAEVPAQQGGAREPAGGTERAVAPVPFGPGERLDYRVKLGLIDVGEGYLQVAGIDTVRGFPSYHLDLRIDASALFGAAHMNDRYQSWLDTRTLVSRRFIRDIDETGYQGRRVFEIYPEERRWERMDADKADSTPSILPLDEISFIYYVRTLPLKVGEVYNLNRYFKLDGNPVTVKVLRRERVSVPAGTFDAIVVQPVIRTSGLFSEGGEAELYFTDDEARHLVFLRSKVPVVGSLSLHLTALTRGEALEADAPSGSGR